MTGRRNTALRRTGRRLAYLVAGATVVRAATLRQRVAKLAVLAPADIAARPDHRFLTAAGVELDEATRRAASAYAVEHGLDALDLVPGDLPVEQTLELARRWDPVQFTADPFALGGGACHALLANESLLERAGITETDQLDPVAIARATMLAKQYASSSTSLAVAPGLKSIDERIDKRRKVVRELFPVSAKARPVVEAAPYVGVAAAIALNPVAGALAAALYSAQPVAVFAGSTTVVPKDARTYPPTRLWRGPARWVRSLRGEPVVEPVAEIEAHRAQYAADVAAGVDRYFEPRRDTCPWCGSTDLSVRIRTTDLLQGKPGQFVLEECGACSHIFQNPRLTIDGLDFYYRDFYDGSGADLSAYVFGRQAAGYEGRTAMVAAHTAPKRWLDVGTGHGHFCITAKQTFRDTVFDGLDMSDAIDEAQRRGWVSTGYRGMFPALADSIAGQYDVVSMHHYLEHTREPYEELDAAATVLADDGFLLIEVPNPESRFGRLFGRYWVPWFQPQHQHMIPFANLEAALADRGFTVVAADRGEASTGVDLLGASMLGLQSALGVAALMPSMTTLSGAALWSDRIRRWAVYGVGSVLVPIGLLADGVIYQYIRRTDGGNAYRLLAHKAATT